MKKTYQEKLSELSLRIKNEDLAKYLYSFSIGTVSRYEFDSLSESDYRYLLDQEKKAAEKEEKKKEKEIESNPDIEEVQKLRFELYEMTRRCNDTQKLKYISIIMKNIIDGEK